MNIEVDLKKYEELLKDFSVVFSKRNLKKGGILKLTMFMIGLLAILVAGRFIFEEYQKLYDILIIVVLALPLLMLVMMLLMYILAKKRKVKVNIAQLNYSFTEKIECNVKFINGSETKTEYNYEDIKEVIETNKGYYMFLENNMALIIGKDDVTDVDAFKQLLASKNIKIEAIDK